MIIHSRFYMYLRSKGVFLYQSCKNSMSAWCKVYTCMNKHLKYHEMYLERRNRQTYHYL